MGRAVVGVLVSLCVVPVSFFVNRLVPDPYMDEIFHIPQARHYCNGDFKSWDPMITTPPGLYYLSLALVTSLFPGIFYAERASFSDACSVWVLRSVNGILVVVCGVLFYEILIHLNPSFDKRMATFSAVVMSLYPLHWFFAFLYYTDVASVTTVMAMYLACLKGKNWSSASLGAFAVLIRQTNIVWTLFVATVSILEKVSNHKKQEYVASDMKIKKNGCFDSVRSGNKKMGSDEGSSKQGNTTNCIGSEFHPSGLRGRRLGVVLNAGNNMDYDEEDESSHLYFSGLYNELRMEFFFAWYMKWDLLVFHGPFFLILVAFVAFVYWNGGVVLGAKDAHSVSPHFAQMLYFGIASALATTPLHFSSGITMKKLLKDTPSCLFHGILALSVGFIVVHFFSIAHPYLLADNRHYTFYIWRKVVAAHWLMKYIMVPLYIYSWVSIIILLGKRQKRMWIWAYTLSTAAALVPAPLIELRYYTTPFFLMLLHSPIEDVTSLVTMGCLYVAVDTFTMYMFLLRPFHWAHEPGTQRFIW